MQMGFQSMAKHETKCRQKSLWEYSKYLTFMVANAYNVRRAHRVNISSKTGLP